MATLKKDYLGDKKQILLKTKYNTPHRDMVYADSDTSKLNQPETRVLPCEMTLAPSGFVITILPRGRTFLPVFGSSPHFL